MTDVIWLRHARCIGDETSKEHDDWPILKSMRDTWETHLSEQGMLEAMITGKRIGATYGGHKIYLCESPWHRTVETEELVAAGIAEQDSGPYEENLSPPAAKGEFLTALNKVSDGTTVANGRHAGEEKSIFIEHLANLPGEANIEGLHERDCGILEGQSLEKIWPAIAKVGDRADIFDFLLYGDVADFAEVGKEMGLHNPEKEAESFLDTYKRAYSVAYEALRFAEKIDQPGEKNVLILTSHKVFLAFAISAFHEVVKERHYGKDYLGDRKYHPSTIIPYRLESSHFARFEVNFRMSTSQEAMVPHAPVPEIGEHSHLEGLRYMDAKEKTSLILRAKDILNRTIQ